SASAGSLHSSWPALMRATYWENGSRRSRSRRSEGSMWHRVVNASRLAPLEIANSIKAATAPAATVNSRILRSSLATCGHAFDSWRHSDPARFFRLSPAGRHDHDPACDGSIDVSTSKSGWTGARALMAASPAAGALNILSGRPDGFSVSVAPKLFRL